MNETQTNKLGTGICLRETRDPYVVFKYYSSVPKTAGESSLYAQIAPIIQIEIIERDLRTSFGIGESSRDEAFSRTLQNGRSSSNGCSSLNATSPMPSFDSSAARLGAALTAPRGAAAGFAATAFGLLS